MFTGVATSSARNGFALGLSAGLTLASAFFLVRGDLPVPAWSAAPVTDAKSTAAAVPDGKAGSMGAATLALKTRLALQGGSDEQWELLAKSYDFLGRQEEAALARRHEVSRGGDLADAVSVSAALLPGGSVAGMAVATGRAGTDDPSALLASAERHRHKREFKEACADYLGLVRLGAMTADTWADYADAEASLNGSLSGQPEQAIAQALSLEPQHTKALWLKASLAHEQHRYQDALATWRQLLPLVPAGSSDARIVQANIAEATRLAAG